MPKIVDHDRRRTELGEAAWRIIRREGLEAVTVRNVAKEAEVSLGSLRHYFSTQSELLAFSLRLVSDRVKGRLADFKPSGDVRADAECILWELLPLDEEKRAESEVWLAFTGRKLTDPALAELNAQVYDELYAGMLRLVRALIVFREAESGASSGLDAELEARRLNALVDGLLVHGVSRPDIMTPETIRRIVRLHLDRLFSEA